MSDAEARTFDVKRHEMLLARARYDAAEWGQVGSKDLPAEDADAAANAAQMAYMQATEAYLMTPADSVLDIAEKLETFVMIDGQELYNARAYLMGIVDDARRVAVSRAAA